MKFATVDEESFTRESGHMAGFSDRQYKLHYSKNEKEVL